MSLKIEIATDPLTRGYAGMTDQQLVDSLNAVNRTRNRTSMTGDEMFAPTDAAEWQNLSAANQLLWVSFCGRSEFDPFGGANVAFVTDLFSAGSATLTALAAARVETISRAQELGLRRVKLGHVFNARKL